MKRFIGFTLLLALACAGVALAAGLPHTPGNTIIQNLDGIAPTKGASGCVTQSLTKEAFGTFTTMTGYTGFSAEVVDSAGAAVPIKWNLDGSQVAVGSTFKFTNSGGNTYSRVLQQPYSTASRSLTTCVRRQ